MVEIYVKLIINGRRTFERVPVNLQQAVKNELEAAGLGVDGKPFK